jgi:hypothetical protein
MKDSGRWRAARPAPPAILLFALLDALALSLVGSRSEADLDFVGELAQRKKAVERTVSLAGPFHHEELRIEQVTKENAARGLVHLLATRPTGTNGLLIDPGQIDVQRTESRSECLSLLRGDRGIVWKSHR